jgi:hypothetical protein
MDHQRPDQDSGLNGARVEDDFIRPLRPMKGFSHRRLPAALPFALAGILVVSGVAFGATVVRSLVTPSASATPVVVGDDDPTDEPTLEVTEAPSEGPIAIVTEAPAADPTDAPATGELSLTVEALAGKARLNWSAYTGDGFAYYKVVRSTDATAAWPLGEGDKLVAAIDNKATITYLDASGAGTFTWQVFAVKSSDAGYQILASSAAKTATIAPAKTYPPAVGPVDLGALTVKDNGDGTYTFKWSAYTGGTEFSYYKLSGVPYPDAPGYVETGSYWNWVSPDCESSTYKVPAGTWNVNVEAVYYPNGNKAVLAKTSTLKLVVEGSTKTAPPFVTLTLNGNSQADGVHLTWTKYTGSSFQYYKVVRSVSSEPTWPLCGDTTLLTALTNASTDTFTDTTAEPGHTYKYRVYVWTSEMFTGGGGTILAISNIKTISVPAVTPPPAASESPTV